MINRNSDNYSSAMWQANQTIKDERFLIQEVLGGGGFGVAYRALDRKSNQQVVIKTLNQRQQNQADFTQQQEKFVNEAMTLKGLPHPHIVKVYELIQEQGLWGMVMEYIDGQELAEYIDSKGNLTEAQALEYIKQVGEALVYIHAQGFLHRDIKPHNIMLRKGNREAVLIDFGLARGFIDGKTLSMTNSLTQSYAPIEQYDRQGHFGAYTDVYALAATLYHLLTGEAPIFNAKGRKEAQDKGQSIDGFLWDKIPEAVSARTKQGIIKGMAVLPDARPQTMAEFLQSLGLGAESVPSTPTPPPPRNNPQPVTPVTPTPITPPPLNNPPPVITAVNPPPRIKETSNPTPPQPRKRSPDLATRRNFIKWLGFGGAGAMSVLAISQIGKNVLSDSNTPKLTKIQFTSVKLDNKGKVIDKPSGSAEVFTEDLGDGVKLTMVKIPGGKFLMGSPASEKERSDSESPQHQVNVPEFYLGQTQVTQSQYQAIMGNNPSHFKGNDKLPVESVDWQQAMDFCQKLSQKTGRSYRLPSEAEWEYACRAGSTTPFAFGETITPEIVNYNGNYTYGGAAKGEYRQKTTPVGTFPPNLFGLYDLHGNVWEWCLDEWVENYNGAPTDGSARGDILSREENKARLLRGGSWLFNASDCRSANRSYIAASYRNYDIGFRVVSVPSRTT